MNNENKTAKEWYAITYRDLANLMNQHYQISQASPFHDSLPRLAAHIRCVAACCELWKRVAYSIATQKFFKGG